MFFAPAAALARLAVEPGLRTMCEWAEMARAGYAFGYGPDFLQLQRRIANYCYVARILGGALVGELPIEELTRFAFTVDLRAAKALDLSGTG